jgi:hypothetical protein
MSRVLAALTAKLTELQPLGRGFAILGGRVVLVLALYTLQGADFAGHVNSF